MNKKQDYNYQKQATIKTNDGWEGEEAIVHSEPMLEGGGGAPIIVRRFDFNLPPGLPTPTGELLLNFHKSKIIAFLWKDELELIREPRIEFSKSKEKFRIFATCKAKKGSIINERPQLLQEMTNDSQRNS